jgi:hypothetical protein
MERELPSDAPAPIVRPRSFRARSSAAKNGKRRDCVQIPTGEKKMNRTKRFESVGRRFAVLIGLATIGILFSASGAKAGCGLPVKPGEAPPIPFVSPHANAPSKDQHDEDSRGRASIVGLWHVAYTATSVPVSIPAHPFDFTPPFPFLESYKIWHGDGTEFENAFLPPDGGNICFGVWKDSGDGKVKSDTPRRAGGLMSGAASKAVDPLV